jgi:hypothetical protein
MKQIWLLLFAALFVYAEESTLLHFSHTFETMVAPDRIATSLSATFQDTQSATATRNAQEALRAIPDASGHCSGGGISLQPAYRHEAGRSERIGFIAAFTLRCESADGEAIDRIITQADEATTRFDGTLNLQPPKRIISAAAQLKAQSALESEAIGWATRRLNALAGQFAQRACQLSELRFEPHNSASAHPVMRTMSQESALPIQSSEAFSLTLHWRAQCR